MLKSLTAPGCHCEFVAYVGDDGEPPTKQRNNARGAGSWGGVPVARSGPKP
jgi:hypothetical protein